MAEPTDRVYQQVLVVRCQLGDPRAVEELVACFQPRLRAFLYKMMAGRRSVDDLAQEVWMDVLRDLPRLADPGAFVPWFYRIARNRVFRLLRRREPAPSINDLAGDVADAAEEPADFTAEDAEAVHAALDRLNAEHREVLLLRFMEDMSYEQIAQAVGRPVGTVRSRIYNAKRELRVMMERQP